jgi:ABC-2 type transport system ATP-binding protein
MRSQEDVEDGGPEGLRTGGPDDIRGGGPDGVLAEASRVSMRFGSFTAVSETDLAVRAGEVVGLLGANGAGKTTLIRLLLGLLQPSSGVVRLLGSAPSTATRRRIGYVPQTLGLYASLTVAENWSFTAAAFRNRSAPMPERVAAWHADLVGRLPLGAQRQVAFAVALSHRPELLILDEPTSGVGPLGRARLWEDIRQAADRGAGVLVTTHNMEEAEQCDRLVVMADSKVVAAGTAASIIGDRTVTEVRCAAPNRAFTLLDAAGCAVQAHGLALRVDGTAEAVSSLLRRDGIEAAIEIVPANLEEAFVAIATAPGTAA